MTGGSKNVHELTIFSYSVVAVHGQNGHWENTFTAANGVCWLRTLLPKHAPNIRVLSYGYDARTHGSSPFSQEHLHGHAEQLIRELRRERTITEVNMQTIALPRGLQVRPQESKFLPVTGLHSVLWKLYVHTGPGRSA